MINITDEMRDAFDILMHESEKKVELNELAEQVIVVKTLKDNVYSFVNEYVMKGNYDAENQFIRMLEDNDDAEVKYIVCMWNDGNVDMPSMNLRMGLLDICAQNANAIWVGQGAGKLTLRTIKDSMP